MPKIRAWPVVASVLLVASLALGLILTSTDLLSGRDAALSENLHSLDSGWIHGVAAAVSAVFSAVGGLLIVVIWAATLVLRGRRLAALTTCLTVVVGWGATMLIKYLLGRPRPPFSTAGDPAYPSGHTALALALVCAAFFLARRADVRDAIVTVGGLTVVGVMFCRVIAGAHFLTDTVGAVLATSGAIVMLSGVWNVSAPHVLRRVPALAEPAVPGRQPPDVPARHDAAHDGAESSRAYPPAKPLAPPAVSAPAGRHRRQEADEDSTPA